MANEAIYITAAILDLLFVVLALRQGREGLIGVLIVNIVLVSTFGSKLIETFGIVSNAGNIFYGVTFFIGAVITEHWGKKDGYRSVLVGFISLALFVLLSQLLITATAYTGSEPFSQSIKEVFSSVPRIALASMAAYLVSQNINIAVFSKMRSKKNGEKTLWLANMTGAVFGQLADSVLFFTIAFAGVLSVPVLIETMIGGYILKIGVAALAIPFFYASHKIREV